MVSPEVIRRFQFFSGLSIEQIVLCATVADEITFEPDNYIFRDGEELHKLYLVVEGNVSLVMKIPRQEKDVILSNLGNGDVFGWSSLVPPNIATAGAKAQNPCKLLAFDCPELIKMFEKDCQFGYLIMEKIAQVIRGRLRNLRMETLAYIAG